MQRCNSAKKGGSEQTFLPKIGADLGQFSIKFRAKSGKLDQVGIKTQINYLNIPWIQPWFYVLRFFHKVVFYKKSKIRSLSGAYFPICPEIRALSQFSGQLQTLDCWCSKEVRLHKMLGLQDSHQIVWP